MASSAKFSKRAQDSSLGRLVDEVLAHGTPDDLSSLPNAIDFVQSTEGLGIRLYPVQRIITKAMFGIPMDYKEDKVPVWDMYKTKLLFTFTDREYLHWVHEEGRCNFGDWQDLPDRGFGTGVFYIGRRAGKSQLVSAIGTTLLRNLLALYDPQDYYNLVKGSDISFTMIGTDEDSSGRLYQKMRADVGRSAFFNPYIKGNGETEMTFVSKADRETKRDTTASIKVTAYPCTTRSVRGPSSYMLALDEFQHFRSSKDANSDDLYKAATPSTSYFVSKDDPELADSKILIISSPLTKIGKMYELHKRAMDEGSNSNIFTLRCSTVEMNPYFPRAKVEEELADNPDTFVAEIGGEFLEGSGSYVPEVVFNACVDEGRQNITRFNIATVGRRYFWGLDLGMRDDATALAIGHLEMVENQGIQLIYDYVDRMMVGEMFEGPGVPYVSEEQKYIQHIELLLPDIVSWLVYMNEVLPCFDGVTDQHGGTMLKQLLQLNGINSMELVHLDQQKNSRMYFTLKGFVDNAAARFPDVKKFITEFKHLKASYASKYVLKVEAPSEKGSHDDMGDAVALVAWRAQEWLDKEGHLDLDPSAKILQVDPNLLPPVPLHDIGGLALRDIQAHVRLERQLTTVLPHNMVAQPNPYTRPRRRR